MSRKKSYGIALVIGVLLAAVILLPLGSQAADKFTIKAVSAWPKTVFEVQNFLQFLELVRAKVAAEAPGQLEIRYLGGPEVIPNSEQVEAARNRLVDMVFTTSGYYVSAVPEADALNLSHLRPWEERAKGVNELLNKIHQEKVNCFYLGRLGADIPFTLYLTKPIRTADLKGLSIRCSPTHVPMLKKLRAQPVVIPPPDVYTALERGVCQGLIWPAGLITDWGWDKVVKFTVDPDFYIANNMVLINLDTWKKLPPNLQKLLISAEEKAEHEAVERGMKRVKESAEAMAKQGMKTIKLPEPQAKKLTDAAYSSLWEVIVSKSPQYGPKLKEMLSK